MHPDPLSSHFLSGIAAAVTLVAGAGCAPERGGPSTDGLPGAPPPKLETITSVALQIQTPPGHSPGGATPLFRALPPEESGIHFSQATPPNHPRRQLFASAMVSGGVAVGDLNGDRLPDLFFASGPGENSLYYQSGNQPLRFEPADDSPGISGGDSWGTGAAILDIDNDGDNDLFVCNHGSPNQLFLNSGTTPPTFVESAAAFGLAHDDASHTPSFCDYDRDGDPDLYLLTNRYYHPDGSKGIEGVIGMENGLPAITPAYERYFKIMDVRSGARSGTLDIDYDVTGRQDRLLRNDGTKFTDVSFEAGVRTEGRGLSATWWDYNKDGYPDLYVANDFEDPDHFFLNNGDGTFTDLITSAVPHTPWFSMGADFTDIDGDGHTDFLVADMSGTNHYKQKVGMGAMGANSEFLRDSVPKQYMRNALYLNTGRGRFREGAYLTGLADSDWTWSVKLRDFDCDGRPDVFFSNGMSRNFNESDLEGVLEFRPGENEWDRHQRAGTKPLREQNLAFRNEGGLNFSNATSTWLPERETMSFATAAADLDRDGDLDLVVVNLDEPASILENTVSGPGTNRILIRLKGTWSHRNGLGARVTLDSQDTGKQERFLTLVRGYQSADEPLVHFGLGHSPTVDSLTVHWPSGHGQEFSGLEPNRLYTITEPEGDPPPRKGTTQAPSALPFFAEDHSLDSLVHKETPHDDFETQPLLPAKLSQLGPPLATGDIDGDGDTDFYLGGASGQPGQLIVNHGGGDFASVGINFFSTHAASEDMGALFFEADGDGDLDLFVVSGGVEQNYGSTTLLDRLYLNDGKGAFTSAPEGALPYAPASGSGVVAADYDRDGDLDLFVGGRVTPGRYPFAPANQLLKNNGDGTFADVTAKIAPETQFSGMATAVLWSDMDADGWSDLLIAHEWGPVSTYRNNGKTFEETTAKDAPTGWWNSLTPGDFDGDGDIDYLAGNLGLNTKYHASPESPALLYAGDMDGTGQLRLIEGEYEGNTLFPVRGRSCSSSAIPFLNEKFDSYHDFALASLEKIYSPATLTKAKKFAATELASGIFNNDGSGNLTFTPLPRLAQLAPVFGAAVTELNGDIHPDIVLVQNSFSPQLETGRMDGATGLVLTGSPGGTFTTVPLAESGFLVPGDAKSLVLFDADGDGLEDALVGINDAPVQLFLRQPRETDKKCLRVTLVGKTDNPHAIGARASLTLSNGHRQYAEISAGSGYLSQSPGALRFGIPQGETASATLEVHWPDGETSTHGAGGTGGQTLRVTHPSFETVRTTTRQTRAGSQLEHLSK